MLVLTRRVGEEIIIASEIRVTIVAVNGQRVRLGITAPRSVNVARRELLARNFKPPKSLRDLKESIGAATERAR
jgi:carbon storage regulator